MKLVQYNEYSVSTEAGIILYMRPANERWRYTVTLSLIGWAHTQNDPCWGYWWPGALAPGHQ